MTDLRVLAVLLGDGEAALPPDAERTVVELLKAAQRRDVNVWRRINLALGKGAVPTGADRAQARLRLARLAVGLLARAQLGGKARSFVAAVEDALRDEESERRFQAALERGLLRQLLLTRADDAVAGRAVLEMVGGFLRVSVPPTVPAPPTGGDDGPPTEPTPHEEDEMSFYMDLRGLPPELGSLEKQNAYVAAVRDQIRRIIGNVEPNALAHAEVVGKLLLGGQFRADSGSFPSFVKRAYDELVVPYDERGGRDVTGIEVLAKIGAALGVEGGEAAASGSTNGNGHSGERPVAYQQLAFIYDAVVQTLPVIAHDDPGLRDRVARAFLDYASGDLGSDQLDIPGFDQTLDQDVVPENMLAVGKVYAAYQLEQLKLFAVVDRIAELWRNGLVPIGSDSGGRLLNTFYWDREDRLSEGNRFAHYARLFGAKGADVSKEVNVNAQFEPLMTRFLTNVAQYKRLTEMQVVSSDPAQSRSLVSENVRKTGRELSANLSLYGWGATHFDASRIAGHVRVAFDIVKDAQVQKAFGATSPWQVIERVAQQEFGVTPNIVKYQAMAASGQEIIRILAAQPAAFVTSLEEIDQALKPAPQTFDSLARHALAWLSVNGTTTEQLSRLSQPVEAVASPSLPLLSQPTAPTNGAAGPDLGRLRDMVAAGRMPSMDELRGFIH
ncbi:MAG: hypothetical protein QM767_29245 [Anaeromyxobacter sp.]